MSRSAATPLLWISNKFTPLVNGYGILLKSSGKMSERFHKAARDGYMKTLQQATKRDCNGQDESGMTPTACAAFEGNLEALRLIVSRGGDPDKCDNFGNTSLHCAAVKGHMPCVTFLVNFGVNLYALDNQYHSAKDLAAIAGKQEVLRFLDSAAAKLNTKDPAGVKKAKEKAEKDVAKRLEKTEKIQKKMDKQREEEQKKLDKERELLDKVDKGEDEPRRKSIIATISRGSLAFINKPRRDSKLLYTNSIPSAAAYTNSPTFSDLTTNPNAKKTSSSIQKKIFNRKVLQDTQNNRNVRNGEFKVREGDTTGTSSVRHLTGLRRDSEIILVPDASLSMAGSGAPGGKHAKLSEVFEDTPSRGGGYTNMGGRTQSVPDFGNVTAMQPKGSIFDRPGFGSVAFRNTMTGTFSGFGGGLSSFAGLGEEEEGGEEGGDEGETPQRPPRRVGRDGLGSAGSLHQDSSSPFEEEDLPSDDESGDTPLYLFLAGLGLTPYIATFTDNHVDLAALKLLTEEDLKELGLPLGPRRKLLKVTQAGMGNEGGAVEEEDTSL